MVKERICGIPIICEESVPWIGENGNWFVGEEDTGIRAQGRDGAAGAQGPKGDKGDIGEQGPVGMTGPQGVDGKDADMSRVETLEAEMERMSSEIIMVKNRAQTIGYIANEHASIELSGNDSTAYFLILSDTKNGVGVYSISRYINKSYIICPIVDRSNYTLSIAGNILNISSTYATGYNLFRIAK